MAPTNPTFAESTAKGYEVTDTRPKPVLGSVFIVSLIAAAGFASMWGLYGVFTWYDETRGKAPSPFVAEREKPPAPLLQTVTTSDLEGFRAREHEALSTYSWANRGEGLVRLPIARAKELVLERGLPAAGLGATDNVEGNVTGDTQQQ